MALIVELRVAGRVVGGTEVWWDDTYSVLEEAVPGRYPILRRIDPYEDAAFSRGEIDDLRLELSDLQGVARRYVRVSVIDPLLEVCGKAVGHEDAELHFVGD